MFPPAFRRGGDRGQALPVYITVIGALLFLAFAYFAVGQAAATRGGAQTAADSAALAAAQDRGGQIRDALLRALGPGGSGPVGRLLDGVFPGLVDSCGHARKFALANRAHTVDCAAVPGGYRVRVVTDYTVGRSVVPGTEHTHGHATATAVTTPLCRWRPNPHAPSAAPSASASAQPPPGPGPSGSPGGGGTPAGTLVCRDGTWTVDPSHLGDFPSVADLFSVHLTR